MSHVFKTRYFSRWMRKTELTDKALCNTDLGVALLDGTLQEICHDQDQGE